MDLKLHDKTAFVSGSYRGTGFAIASALAREGALVAVHGFDDAPTKDAAERICADGGRAVPVVGDILSDAGAREVMAATERTVGAVHVLVNNYGTADRGRWLDGPDEAGWTDAYNKNVLSAMRLTELFAPAMKARGWGRIVMLGTVGSTQPGHRMPGYYAAKGALATMTASLAKGLARTGITVNLVSPGLIRTREVEERFLAQGKREGWGETWDEIEPRVLENFMDNLTGHVPRVEEVADLVAFLASPRAGAITGVNYRVDGGSSALTI